MRGYKASTSRIEIVEASLLQEIGLRPYEPTEDVGRGIWGAIIAIIPRLELRKIRGFLGSSTTSIHV